MSATWLTQLKYDPIPTLLASSSEAVVYFAKRDLQGTPVSSIRDMWKLPEALKILRKQQPDGRWSYPTPKGPSYDKLETFRQVGFLVEMYGFTKKHPVISQAAEFLFTFQTDEGDFRGIYGAQYSPNYSATIVERLVKAGFKDDKRIKKCLDWLLTMRQDDGGWVIPVRTRLRTLTQMYETKETLQPDRTKPFSHLVTDIVLRAFAAHPQYRTRKEVQQAGAVLKTRFFKPDKYPDHRAASCWTSFQYPFWWSHLISALDSLAQIGFTHDDPDIRKGLDWFSKNQQPDGLWATGYGSDVTNPNRKEVRNWVGLAICRMLKRY